MDLKIKINPKKYLDIFNDAYGINSNKNKIIKNKNVRSISYINQVFIVFFIFYLISLIFSLISFCLKPLSLLILLFDIYYLLISFIRLYFGYKWSKNKKFKNDLYIDEEGIHDKGSFDDMEILFKWKRVKGVIVKEKSVVIVLNHPCYFFFDIKDKDKVINTLKKYHDVTVIDFEK